MNNYASFIFGETLERALDAIPEEHQLKFYKIVKDYGLHGIEPKLSGFELSTWVQMKDLIDNTKPKRGAPCGNANAKKTNADNSGIDLFEKQIKSNKTIQNNSEQINQIETNTNKSPNININSNININGDENKNFEEKPPPSSFFEIIKKEARALGFNLDDILADRIEKSSLDPQWVSCNNNFFKYCADYVRKQYAGKDDTAKRLLFVKAVCEFGNLRLEYPAWKSRQEQIARERERRQRIELLKSHIPKTCECGQGLVDKVCPACGAVAVFCEAEEKWYFRKPGGIGLVQKFKEMREERRAV